MALSRKQAATAWTCFTIMGGMLLYPPWFWEGDPHELSSAQFAAGYNWLWNPPPASAGRGWVPVIWWGRLLDQWLIVAVGMLLLLFLRGVRERKPVPGLDSPASGASKNA